MKLRPLTLLSVLSLLAAACTPSPHAAYQPAEGDVLFQSLPNPPGPDLVDAIEGATGSPDSHCGIVVRKDQSWYVLEAIGPVCETPLDDFVRRSRNGQFRAYRFSAASQAHIPAAIAAMRKDLGKPYDMRYRFDSEAIYCSELIWRGWKAATGKGLGKTTTLGQLDWQPYRPIIEAIEGTTDIPLDREMITPRDLALAPELQQVYPAP